MFPSVLLERTESLTPADRHHFILNILGSTWANMSSLTEGRGKNCLPTLSRGRREKKLKGTSTPAGLTPLALIAFPSMNHHESVEMTRKALPFPALGRARISFLRLPQASLRDQEVVISSD